MLLLCTLCDTEVAGGEARSTIRAESGKAYVYHSSCFDKVAKNTPLAKLRLSAFAVYDDDTRVSSVDHTTDERRCCMAGCDRTTHDDCWFSATCTRCDASCIHQACYYEREKQWLSLLRGQRTNRMNDATLRKAMFGSKYDIIRTTCTCVCGRGFFRVGPTVEEDDMLRRREASQPRSTSLRPPLCRGAVAPKQRMAYEDKSKDAAAPYVDKNVNVNRVVADTMSDRMFDDLVGCPPADPRICPITRVRIREAAQCSDGYTYEASALREWIKRRGTSPISCLPAAVVC